MVQLICIINLFIVTLRLSLYDKLDSVTTMEIDFLIRKPIVSNRHNISPIEIKSGKNYTTRSLDKFPAKYSQQLAVGYIILHLICE